MLKVFVEQEAIPFKSPLLQGDQLNMAVCLWYLFKSDLSSVQMYIHNKHTPDKSLFTGYQQNTAMFDLSPCRNNHPGAAPEPPLKIKAIQHERYFHACLRVRKNI